MVAKAVDQATYSKMCFDSLARDLDEIALKTLFRIVTSPSCPAVRGNSL